MRSPLQHASQSDESYDWGKTEYCDTIVKGPIVCGEESTKVPPLICSSNSASTLEEVTIDPECFLSHRYG